MKLLSCLLLFFFIEMHYARKRSSHSEHIRIPLKPVRPKMTSHKARARIPLIEDGLGGTKGSITIGNPKQTIEVMFDTGSNDLWVFSNEFDNCAPGSEELRKKYKLYNSTASSSYKPITTYHKNPKAKLIEYSSHWVLGFMGNDNITFDGKKEIRWEVLKVKRTSKGAIEQIPGGVVGLAYESFEENIVSVYCKQAERKAPKFSYYLPTYEEDVSSAKGELMLCGKDESKYPPGSMIYANEIIPGTWIIRFDKISVLVISQRPTMVKTNTVASKTPALFDTGSNRIVGRKDDLKLFFNALEPHLVPNNPFKDEVKCAKRHHLPIIEFTISGTDFQFTPYDYTMEVAHGNCHILIREHEADLWVIGEPFYRKYYTVFDIKTHSIGIAERLKPTP